MNAFSDSLARCEVDYAFDSRIVSEELAEDFDIVAVALDKFGAYAGYFFDAVDDADVAVAEVAFDNPEGGES